MRLRDDHWTSKICHIPSWTSLLPESFPHPMFLIPVNPVTWVGKHESCKAAPNSIILPFIWLLSFIDSIFITSRICHLLRITLSFLPSSLLIGASQLGSLTSPTSSDHFLVGPWLCLVNLDQHKVFLVFV